MEGHTRIGGRTPSRTSSGRRPLTHRYTFVCLALLSSLLAVSTFAGVSPSMASVEDAECTYIIPPEVTKVDGADDYAHVQPGDTLCLPAGTRSNIRFLNLHGQADRPITIRNSGGRVKITGTNYSQGLGLVHVSYLRVTGATISEKCGALYPAHEQECGIEIDNAFKGIKLDTTKGPVHHVEIDHLFIHDTSPVTPTRGIALHPLEGQMISGIFIHHNYLRNTTAEGIYLGTEPHDRPLEILGKLEDVEVSYNLLEQIAYDGIKIKVAVSNVRVHHNIIRDAGTLEKPAHQGGIKMAFSVGEYYNNLIVGAVEGIKMSRVLDNPGTRYYNNIIVGMRDVCIFAEGDDAMVYNNTLVSCGAVGISTLGANPQVFDNIIVDTAGIPIEGSAPGIANNFIGSSDSAGFVNPAANDYHLLSTSPAVDAGRNTGTFPPFDFDGISRPQGPNTDLGAYELVAGDLPFSLYLPLTIH